MATNCKHLQFWKITVFLHFVFLAVIITSTAEARKLRLPVTTSKKLANVYENYKRQVLSVDRSQKRKRHISSSNISPSYKRHVYMFCKTGFLLQIHKSGRISGTSNVSSENALLEIQIFDQVIRRVKGVASGRYLSINDKGRLVSSNSVRSGKNAFFVENDEENGWYSYSSKHYSNRCPAAGGFGSQSNHSRRWSLKEWFIAIKENGSLRRPCKTHPGMSATHFCILSPETLSTVGFSTD